MLDKSLRIGFIVTITALISIASYILVYQKGVYKFTIILTFVLALAFIMSLIYIFKHIIDKSEKNNYSWQEIICESDGEPSLSRAQFLTWITVIGIVFVWFLFIKVSIFIPNSALNLQMVNETTTNKTYVPDVTKIESFGAPINLFYLMGLTSFTAIAGKGLSSIKYKRKKAKQKQSINLWSMFLENNRPSSTRYQMFLWTTIGVLAYLGFALANLLHNMVPGVTINSILSMPLPDCPDVLLVLMGVSQATYLGGKMTVQPHDVYITGIFPGNSPKNKDVFTILGYGFEDKGSILFDDTVLDETYIKEWAISKIILSIPEDLLNCEVRVVTKTGKISDPYLTEYYINTVDEDSGNTSSEKQIVMEGFGGTPNV